MGFPEKASRELGERLVESTLTAAVAKIKDLEAKSDGVYKQIPFTPGPLIFD